jgi:hypothetical protein
MTSETNTDFCFTNELNTEETNDSDYEDLPPFPTGEDFESRTVHRKPAHQQPVHRQDSSPTASSPIPSSPIADLPTHDFLKIKCLI